MYIILIAQGGIQINIVGPFESEFMAQMYLDGYLRKAMPNYIFGIRSLTSPQAMFEFLKEEQKL